MRVNKRDEDVLSFIKAAEILREAVPGLTAVDLASALKAYRPDHREEEAPAVAPMLTRKDAAKVAGVCVATIDNAIADGRLKSVKVGRAVRIAAHEIQVFLGLREGPATI